MAADLGVKISFTASESCDTKSIKIVDTTGTYINAINLTGWGGSNIPLSSVLDVQLVVEMPDGTIVTVGSNVLGGTFPSAANNFFYLNMGHLGGSSDSTMTQGLYNINYRVLVNQQGTNAAVWINARKYVFLSSVIKCCVHKMLASLDMCDDCPCDSEKSKALEAYTLYKAMLYANSCGKLEDAKMLFSQVNKLCNYTDTGGCSTCGS
tara:strand:- start:39487 stop:40110 length:624 start_codon:yes stop_codon:yes gene_type:complete